MTPTATDNVVTDVFAVPGELYIKPRVEGVPNDPVSSNAINFSGWKHLGLQDGETGVNVSITSTLHKIQPASAEAWVTAFGESRETAVTSNLTQSAKATIQRAIQGSTQTDGAVAGTDADKVAYGGGYVGTRQTEFSLMLVTKNSAAEEGLCFFFPLTLTEGDVAIAINRGADRMISTNFTVGQDLTRTSGEQSVVIYFITATSVASSFLVDGGVDTSDASFEVDDADGFTATGDAIIEPGQTNEETIAYSDITDDVFTGAVTLPHSAGVQVIQG